LARFLSEAPSSELPIDEEDWRPDAARLRASSPGRGTNSAGDRRSRRRWSRSVARDADGRATAREFPLELVLTSERHQLAVSRRSTTNLVRTPRRRRKRSFALCDVPTSRAWQGDDRLPTDLASELAQPLVNETSPRGQEGVWAYPPRSETFDQALTRSSHAPL
jgi:hypothetical protein